MYSKTFYERRLDEEITTIKTPTKHIKCKGELWLLSEISLHYFVNKYRCFNLSLKIIYPTHQQCVALNRYSHVKHPWKSPFWFPRQSLSVYYTSLRDIVSLECACRCASRGKLKPKLEQLIVALGLAAPADSPSLLTPHTPRPRRGACVVPAQWWTYIPAFSCWNLDTSVIDPNGVLVLHPRTFENLL